MSRTRTRGPLTSVVNQVAGSITIPDNPWPTGAGSDVLVSYEFERMVDNPTRGFERLRNSGSIIVTGMSSFKETFSLTPCQYRIAGPTYETPSGLKRNGYAIVNHDGGTALYPIPGSVSEAQARTRERIRSAACVEALAAVAEPDVESLVSIAEARETFAFLAKPFASAIRLARGYRGYVNTCERLIERHAQRYARWEKRNPKYRGEPPELKLPKWTVGKFTAFDIPSAWLALRYGLMPIYYDIAGIIKAAQSKTDVPVRKTYRARRQEGDNFASSSSVTGSYGETYTTAITGDWLVLVRAGCVAEFSASWSQKFGAHYSLIPSAAWEMVTLSFAVDWIVNVGDFLKALTVRARADIKGSWVVAITDTKQRVEVTGSAPSGILLEISPTPVCVRTFVDKTRDTDIGQYIAVTRDVKMNLSRFADLASLFALLVFGKKGR